MSQKTLFDGISTKPHDRKKAKKLEDGRRYYARSAARRADGLERCNHSSTSREALGDAAFQGMPI